MYISFTGLTLWDEGVPILMKVQEFDLVIDMYSSISTVQAFNSCTSHPDVCQCMVVQKPMDMMSKIKPSTSMTHVVYVSPLE